MRVLEAVICGLTVESAYAAEAIIKVMSRCVWYFGSWWYGGHHILVGQQNVTAVVRLKPKLCINEHSSIRGGRSCNAFLFGSVPEWPVPRGRVSLREAMHR